MRKVHKIERPNKDEHVVVQMHLLDEEGEDMIVPTNIETIQTKIETVLGQSGHEPALATLIVSEI